MATASTTAAPAAPLTQADVDALPSLDWVSLHYQFVVGRDFREPFEKAIQALVAPAAESSWGPLECTPAMMEVFSSLFDPAGGAHVGACAWAAAMAVVAAGARSNILVDTVEPDDPKDTIVVTGKCMDISNLAMLADASGMTVREVARG